MTYINKMIKNIIIANKIVKNIIIANNIFNY